MTQQVKQPVKYVLFPIEDLPCGRMRPVDVDGISIVVIRTPDGKLSALRNNCPHRGAPMSSGFLLQRVLPVVRHEFRLDQDSYVIRCPWHNYEFEVESGRCLIEGDRNLRSYPVTVEDGKVVLSR